MSAPYSFGLQALSTAYFDRSLILVHKPGVDPQAQHLDLGISSTPGS